MNRCERRLFSRKLLVEIARVRSPFLLMDRPINNKLNHKMLSRNALLSGDTERVCAY